MAISISNLIANRTSAVSSVDTASISPGANKLILATVTSRRTDSVNAVAPTLSGNGLTWVQIASIAWDTDSSSRKTTTLFRAMGASPSAGAVTIDFSGTTQAQIYWVIDEVSGMDTSGTNGSGAIVQSQTGKNETTTGTLTITLSALSDANNASYGTFSNDHAGWTVGTGYTQLGVIEETGQLLNVSEYKATGSTTVDATVATSAGNKMGGVAVEIKIAGAAAPTAHNLTLLGVGT